MEEKVIFNRYKLIRKVGQGGNAEVFLAFDTFLKREVAIKILKTPVDEDNDEYKLYKQEITTMGTLSHQNIVHIYDCGVEDNHPFVVMEFVRGQSLRQIIDERSYLSIEEFKIYFDQVLDGMEYAHLHKIIHRDIKPQNIIIKTNGLATIIDFGTAYILDTQFNAYDDEKCIGSVHYMAPEYPLERISDIKIDIYSLGITMFEMLTGKLPFVDKDTTHKSQQDKYRAVIKMQKYSPLPKATIYNPKLTQEFEDIINKACCKEREGRYNSCKEMKDAISLAYDKYKHPEKYKKSNNIFKHLFLKKGSK